MVRTRALLIPFIRHHLEMDSFENLKYEDEDTFYIDLPHLHRANNREYEAVVRAWYEYNGKNYTGYSRGKCVIQAVLRKSSSLVALERTGKRLRFRFATRDEVNERRS